MQTQFLHALADGCRISDMAEAEAVKARGDQSRGSPVLQTEAPLSENLGLLQLEHIVVQKLQMHKPGEVTPAP